MNLSSNTKILVTGGSGYLGRGLLRQARLEHWDAHFTIFSRDEYKQDLCRQQYPEASYLLGDVRDPHTFLAACTGQDLIIHAAALKYIPEAELNAEECIGVNIDGSRNVLHAALRAGVRTVIGISTDKACQPVNIYGATKMVMERLFAEYASKFNAHFQCVRYGNVVGSTGSVIPLFQRQFKELGHVKVTNPKMTRFWMSIQEAIGCILMAAEEDRVTGSVIIPRPKAMSLGELAKSIAGDNIEVIGARVGEKEHETLIHYQESTRVKSLPGYYELVPVSYAGYADEPFTVSSLQPHAGFITPAEMEAMIVDSQGV